MLEMVRLPDPEQVLKSATYELSGGMRQRVGIAMAMSFHPKLLLADEPTSALDVTTQATIVKEMMEVRKNMNIAIIIVTHNMGVAAYMADNIMVMKNGEVVDARESGRSYLPSENRLCKNASGGGAVENGQ